MLLYYDVSILRNYLESATVTTTELRKLLEEVQALKNEHAKAHTETTQLLQENKSLKVQVEELHTQNKELVLQIQTNKRAANSLASSRTTSFERLPQLQNKQS